LRVRVNPPLTPTIRLEGALACHEHVEGGATPKISKLDCAQIGVEGVRVKG